MWNSFWIAMKIQLFWANRLWFNEFRWLSILQLIVISISVIYRRQWNSLFMSCIGWSCKVYCKTHFEWNFVILINWFDMILESLFNYHPKLFVIQVIFSTLGSEKWNLSTSRFQWPVRLVVSTVFHYII